MPKPIIQLKSSYYLIFQNQINTTLLYIVCLSENKKGLGVLDLTPLDPVYSEIWYQYGDSEGDFIALFKSTFPPIKFYHNI